MPNTACPARAEVEKLLAGAQEFVKTVSEKAREKMTDD
jgi:hypothetical protein